MISAVSLRLLYLIFQHMLGLVLLLGRTSSTKDIELLVLRHEVPMLRCTTPNPAWSGRTGPAFAALVRRLPRALRCHRLVTGAPILRWHRASFARGGLTRTGPAATNQRGGRGAGRADGDENPSSGDARGSRASCSRWATASALRPIRRILKRHRVRRRRCGRPTPAGGSSYAPKPAVTPRTCR